MIFVRERNCDTSIVCMGVWAFVYTLEYTRGSLLTFVVVFVKVLLINAFNKYVIYIKKKHKKANLLFVA